jgi:hypothetical protein
LHNLGVIDYRRGHITVLDRPRLETLVCECYEVVKCESERLLPWTSPRSSGRIDGLVRWDRGGPPGGPTAASSERRPDQPRRAAGPGAIDVEDP